jgi:hypothetical protein
MTRYGQALRLDPHGSLKRTARHRSCWRISPMTQDDAADDVMSDARQCAHPQNQLGPANRQRR